MGGFVPPTWTANGLTAPHPNAEAFIATQERGQYNNPWPDQTSISSVKLTFTDAYFLFPVPIDESTTDPALIKAPVPYKF